MAWAYAAMALGQEPPELVAPSEPLTPAEQQARFHLPPGFEIQLVAAEPDIQKPMNLAFDARGRLWVTHSVEYPFPVEEGRLGRDGVTILSDGGPDGRARKAVRFAEGLNIPIGLLPLGDSALVYSIPSIWRLTDVDGDDRADRREALISKVGYGDTHGMLNSFTYWIDGWVYACHGFANTSTLRGVDGSQITMNSGNTFRFRPDGTRLEQWTWGQVNPFGLSFDGRGNLFSADCHTKPIHQLLRGAYYPSFGKPHDGLGYGPEMIDHLHGSTGIAGLVIYEADHFPEAWRGTAFIGNPVTGRINHDRLERRGSTFRAVEQPDFLSCDDPWFRPVDVQLGPDGALYVADFYNCIIGHYEVPLTHPRRDRQRGRVWRVVYRGASGPSSTLEGPPDLTRMSTEGLRPMLGHPNLRVRVLASHELAQRDANPITAERGDAITGRSEEVWLRERSGKLPDALAEDLLANAEPESRRTTLSVLADREWPSSRSSLAAGVRGQLEDADPFVRRAAADALGRHPAPENLAPLLELWKSAPADDTHLIHAARMALRDQLRAPGAYATARELAAGDADAARRLAEVSLGAHTPESAAFVLEQLTRPDTPRGPLETELHHAALEADEALLPSVYAFAEAFQSASLEEQTAAVRALQRAARARDRRLPEAMADWGDELALRLLAHDEEPRVREGLELARELRSRAALPEVEKAAGRQSRFPELRTAAIDVAAEIDGRRCVELLAALAGDASEPHDVRHRCCQALGRVGGEPSQRALVKLLETLPAGLDVEAAQSLANSREGGERLLTAVEAGKASPRLLKVRGVEIRLENARLPDLAARVARLTADLPAEDARLAELLEARRQGFRKAANDDQLSASGESVYAKRCANCHRLGNRGQKIGPELDGVWSRGGDRLLEDILDPSRNVDQAFRTTLVTTRDGRVVQGLALREEGETLVLADAEGKELRVALADVEERSVAGLSPMPGNWGDQLSEVELYALVSYLLRPPQAAE